MIPGAIYEKPESNAKAKCQPPVAVVLFGLDEAGKPKAATFGEKLAALATTAAQQMHLQIVPIANPALAEIASQLPSGRIYSSGRGLIPFIRRDLYAKLLVAAGPSSGTGQSSTSPEQPANPGGSSSDPQGGSGRRPSDWDAIEPGDLVLDQESPTEGWYAVIVVALKGDMLILRYRDFPRAPKFSENRLNVALLCPTARTADDKEARGTGNKPSAKGTHKGAEPEKSAFPQTWETIDLNHLVLAMDDGPWRSWWEAIPVEIKGDVVTLRWRDYPSLPQVVGLDSTWRFFTQTPSNDPPAAGRSGGLQPELAQSFDSAPDQPGHLSSIIDPRNLSRREL